MARKQSPILDVSDYSNYWFVVQWLSRRFDEEERDLNSGVMSLAVCQAMDEPGGVNTSSVRDQVRASWKELKILWIDGWEKLSANRLPNVDEYFDNLIHRTNKWIDDHFPPINDAPGWERKRLLAAVRQNRMREKRKCDYLNPPLNVSITGELYKSLQKQYDIPALKRSAFVRTALRIVLDDPQLLAKTKKIIGVTV